MVTHLRYEFLLRNAFEQARQNNHSDRQVQIVKAVEKWRILWTKKTTNDF